MGYFLRHERAMDVYMLVLKEQFRGPRYRKLKVEWWVRGEYLRIRQTVKIEHAQWKHWHPCTEKGEIMASWCNYCQNSTRTRDATDCVVCGLSKTNHSLEMETPDDPSDQPERPREEEGHQCGGPQKE